MSFWKKILCAVLAVGLLGMGTTALAAENTQDNYADALQDLGLFQGPNAGYELETDLPREQAITLVVRFLGAEKGENTGERHKNSHGKGQNGCGHSVGLSLKQIDKGIEHIQNGGDAQNDIENADDQACGFFLSLF